MADLEDAAAVLTWDAFSAVDVALLEWTADVLVVALVTASFVALRLAMPIRPPLKKPPADAAAAPLPLCPAPEPKECPMAPAIVPTPLAAINASASMEPPVCPTLTPKLAKKLSIFCEALRKPMAHKNQISTFPVTVSRPTESTCACTSASLIANAGIASDMEKTSTRRKT